MRKKMTEIPFIKGRYLHDIAVTTKLTEDEFKSFKKYCDKNNLSMSFVIRELIKHFLTNINQV